MYGEKYSERLRARAAKNPWYDWPISNKLVSKAMARALGMAVPEVFGVFAGPEDLDLDALPGTFVLKREKHRAAVLLVRDGVDHKSRPCTTDGLREYITAVRTRSPRRKRGCRFFAEEYIMPSGNISPNEHRLFVIGGRVRFIQVDFDRFTERKQVVYTPRWERTPYWSRKECFCPGHPGFEKPPCLDAMISFAEKFARAWQVPAMVVDLYVKDGEPVFGEAGIFHMAGAPIHPEWDVIMGATWPRDKTSDPSKTEPDHIARRDRLLLRCKESRIPMFSRLVIETQSNCNRACATCLRTTYPDKERIAERAALRPMPTELVYKVIDDAVRMGFCGQVCLSFFNEPLLDARLADFGRRARGTGVFSEVYANTNGDLLGEVNVRDLDGAFDHLNVAVYGEHAAERKDRIRDLFRETKVRFTSGQHSVTHFSPCPSLEQAVTLVRGLPCRTRARMRCIIAYTGDMRLCCEDIAGEWALGNVRARSVEDLWFSPQHVAILLRLGRPGGRASFPYCAICPRR